MSDKKEFKNNFAIQQFLKISGQNLVLPLYHTLSDNEPIPFIEPIYKPRSVEKFSEDLNFFTANFNPVSLQDILEKLRTKTYFKEPSFHISFDDGLKTFYTKARPILKAKNISATCFLNNDFIDNKHLFYRYKVALMCSFLSKDKSKLATLKKQKFETTEEASKYLKALKFKDNQEIDQIAKTLGIDFETFLQKEKPYLETEEIKEMITEGFTFGAHSLRHQNFEDLSTEEQLSNLNSSIEDVQKRFNLDYKAFAFPFTDHGVKAEFFEKAKESIDVSFGTAGLKKRAYGYHLQRLPMEKTTSSAESLIQSEYLYYFLKMPFGKNRVKRK